jgi:hypothetical protein
MMKALRFAFESDPADLTLMGQIFYSFLRQSYDGVAKRKDAVSF